MFSESMAVVDESGLALAGSISKQGPARPSLWEVPWREVRVMREDTLLRVSKRTEDTLKIHLCEDTRPGPNEEVYLHTKIHRGPNEDVYLHTKIHRGPNEEVYLEDTPV